MTANWKNRKVLVTGAGGFIGSRLCERLVEALSLIHISEPTRPY